MSDQYIDQLIDSLSQSSCPQMPLTLGAVGCVVAGYFSDKEGQLLVFVSTRRDENSSLSKLGLVYIYCSISLFLNNLAEQSGKVYMFLDKMLYG